VRKLLKVVAVTEQGVELFSAFCASETHAGDVLSVWFRGFGLHEKQCYTVTMAWV